MTDETVTLEFLAALVRDLIGEQRGMREEMSSFRDDMRVMTAIVLRQEHTSASMLEQLRLMVAQHQRTAERVRVLEEG